MANAQTHKETALATCSTYEGAKQVIDIMVLDRRFCIYSAWLNTAESGVGYTVSATIDPAHEHDAQVAAITVASLADKGLLRQVD